MAPRSTRITAAFLGIAVVAGAAGAWFSRHVPGRVELTDGEYLAPPRPLPQFSLIDQQGRPFGASNLHGRWSILFFGYTNCPDFCPSTLSLLASMDRRLAAAKAVRPQVVFVSVDAERDTPPRLAAYVPYFDPAFVGVTAANQPAIEEVARRFGAAVIITHHADGSYAVDHSSTLFVIDPAGAVAAILSEPFTAASLQADFARIVAARS